MARACTLHEGVAPGWGDADAWRALVESRGVLGRAWDAVKGGMSRLRNVISQGGEEMLSALSTVVGSVTPEAVKDLAERGREVAENVMGRLRPILVEEGRIPTITDMLKQVADEAGVAEEMDRQIGDPARRVDQWLQEHLPTLGRTAKAALFTFIWLNVDELSWDPDALKQGFSGGVPLDELIANLPESGIGFLSNVFFGIGFTIMPVMLAARLIWLAQHHYIEWENGRWRPNWQKIRQHARKVKNTVDPSRGSERPAFGDRTQPAPAT